MSASQNKLSISPDGESFPLPEQTDYAAEYERVKALAEAARAKGQEVVVVMGVGFVGAVMAGYRGRLHGRDGRPNKFVIGCQRPSTRSFWKIPLLNRGVSPVKAEDPQVDVLIGRCVNEGPEDADRHLPTARSSIWPVRGDRRSAIS